MKKNILIRTKNLYGSLVVAVVNPPAPNAAAPPPNPNAPNAAAIIAPAPVVTDISLFSFDENVAKIMIFYFLP